MILPCNTIYLADHEQYIETCANWAFETWGRYNPSYTLDKRIASFREHCNKDRIPLTILSFDESERPTGMASLRPNDGIRADLTPWLGSVFVEPGSRRRGIATDLVLAIHEQARRLGYPAIYLLTYEDTLPDWYARLGWVTMGQDSCHGNPVTVMELVL
ncbi:MAG: GNAT family N-acetyltransferase [Cyanobacteria bacterium HKST-UBA02]|nr:GNAT family N-acetyltransferase [Cyanobacteria bacterium HKST-UBA02]